MSDDGYIKKRLKSYSCLSASNKLAGASSSCVIEELLMGFFKHCQILLLVFSLAGCSTLQNQISPNKVIAHSGGADVTLSTANPYGNYILESVNNEKIAEAKFDKSTPRNTSSGGLIYSFVPTTASLRFIISKQDIASNITTSCFRIKDPNGKSIQVETGKFSTDNKFKIPALELNAVSKYKLPKVEEQIISLQNNLRNKSVSIQRLHSSQAYSSGTCIIPPLRPKPDNACSNRSESRETYINSCMPNIICSVYGFVGSSAFSEMILEKKSQEITDDLDFLIQNGCSIAFDQLNNRETDWFVLLRSITVGELTKKFVESWFNDLSAEQQQAATALLSGAANTELCLNDFYNQCSSNWEAWKSEPRNQYKICQDNKKILDASEAYLASSPTLSELEKTKASLVARMKQLEDERNRQGRSHTFSKVTHCD